MAVAEPHRYIQVEDCVNTLIVTHETHIPPEEARIEKLDDRHYRIVSTGEVREYKDHSMTKGDNTESLLKSFARLKALINCNYVCPSWTKFVTLTYAENMTDNDKLRRHLCKFFKRMHSEFGAFRHIYVKERQARGAWHLHAILFFDSVAPWMPNERVREIWGHGFVNVQGFNDDINNLGNYLCAYLTDGGKGTKKGSRLQNYESGIRLYNCSRDVVRPRSSRISYDDYLRICADEDTFLLSEKDTSIMMADGRPIRIKRQIFAVK